MEKLTRLVTPSNVAKVFEMYNNKWLDVLDACMFPGKVVSNPSTVSMLEMGVPTLIVKASCNYNLALGMHVHSMIWTIGKGETFRNHFWMVEW